MSALWVTRAGLHTTAQDLGLAGRAARGASRGGAFDARSLALANRTLGNPPGALGLEVLLQGPTLEVRAPVRFSWCGAPFDVTLDGLALSPLTAHRLAPGQVLRVGRCAVGARCALAFAFGLALPRGARLERGQALPLAEGAVLASAPVAGADATGDLARALPRLDEEPARLRVTDSTHSARFTALARAALVGEPFVVQPSSDRRGVRLRGPRLDLSSSGEPITEGVTLGAVQVTPSGEAIVLGPDQTSTGGYPKIAHVIAADLWRLGQLRPGARVRFERVGFDEARALFLTEDPCG